LGRIIQQIKKERRRGELTSDLKAALIANTAENKMAMDISVLDVRDLTVVTDYFVIATAYNKIQVQAICTTITEEMEKKGVRVIRREGWNEARWVLLDFGDVIVHVFREEERENYDLDRLWGDAKQIDDETISSLTALENSDG
jgi:ribosome-associated protein